MNPKKPPKRPVGRPKGEPTRNITVRLPVDLLDAVDALTRSDGRTLTETMRRALVAYVEQNLS